MRVMGFLHRHACKTTNTIMSNPGSLQSSILICYIWGRRELGKQPVVYLDVTMRNEHHGKGLDWAKKDNVTGGTLCGLRQTHDQHENFDLLLYVRLGWHALPIRCSVSFTYTTPLQVFFWQIVQCSTCVYVAKELTVVYSTIRVWNFIKCYIIIL